MHEALQDHELWHSAVSENDENASFLDFFSIKPRRGQTLTLIAPSIVHKDWFDKAMRATVEKRLQKITHGQIVRLRVEVTPPIKEDAIEHDFADFTNGAYHQDLFGAPPRPLIATKIQRPRLLGADIQIKARLNRSNFVATPNVVMALEAVNDVIEHPTATLYNPLYIHGPHGVGKTHLLHVLAASQKRLCSKVVFQDGHAFVTALKKAKQQQRYAEVLRFLSGTRWLILDDIDQQPLSSEFRAAIAIVIKRGGNVIACGNRSLEDPVFNGIRPLFEKGVSVEMRTAGSNDISQIIDARLIAHNLHLEERRHHQLCYQSSLAEALVTVRRLTLLKKLDVDLSTDASPQNRHKNKANLTEEATHKAISIEAIIQKTSRHFGVSKSEILSESRQKVVCDARSVVMLAMRELLGFSYTHIARHFNKNHTSVMYTVKKMHQTSNAATFLRYLKVRKALES